jgi:hypothetical protein
MKNIFKESLLENTLRGKERRCAFKQKLAEILPKAESASLLKNSKSTKKSKKNIKRQPFKKSFTGVVTISKNLIKKMKY